MKKTRFNLKPMTLAIAVVTGLLFSVSGNAAMVQSKVSKSIIGHKPYIAKLEVSSTGPDGDKLKPDSILHLENKAGRTLTSKELPDRALLAQDPNMLYVPVDDDLDVDLSRNYIVWYMYPMPKEGAANAKLPEDPILETKFNNAKTEFSNDNPAAVVTGFDEAHQAEYDELNAAARLPNGSGVIAMLGTTLGGYPGAFQIPKGLDSLGKMIGLRIIPTTSTGQPNFGAMYEVPDVTKIWGQTCDPVTEECETTEGYPDVRSPNPWPDPPVVQPDNNQIQIVILDKDGKDILDPALNLRPHTNEEYAVKIYVNDPEQGKLDVTHKYRNSIQLNFSVDTPFKPQSKASDAGAATSKATLDTALSAADLAVRRTVDTQVVNGQPVTKVIYKLQETNAKATPIAGGTPFNGQPETSGEQFYSVFASYDDDANSPANLGTAAPAAAPLQATEAEPVEE